MFFFFSSPTANRKQKNTIYLDLFRLFWMLSLLEPTSGDSVAFLVLQ